MRTTLSVSVLLGLLVGLIGVGRADEQSEGQAIIERAIKANGGEANLKKFSAQTWKEKGTYYGMGAGVPYTGTYAMQFPDKFRMDIMGAFIVVLDGDKGWISMGGQVSEMTKEQLTEQKQGHYVGTVTSLLPLKDKSYKLVPIGENKVENRAAVGVKVSKKDHPDVTLWFDKENGRVVKSEARTSVMGKEVLSENYFSSYQELEGAWIPMKMVMMRDGDKFVEAEHFDIVTSEKLDADTFAKP